MMYRYFFSRVDRNSLLLLNERQQAALRPNIQPHHGIFVVLWPVYLHMPDSRERRLDRNVRNQTQGKFYRHKVYTHKLRSPSIEKQFSAFGVVPYFVQLNKNASIFPLNVTRKVLEEPKASHPSAV